MNLAVNSFPYKTLRIAAFNRKFQRFRKEKHPQSFPWTTQRIRFTLIHIGKEALCLPIFKLKKTLQILITIRKQESLKIKMVNK
jgi:transposase